MLAKKCDRCGKLYEHYDIFNNTRRNGISIIHRDKFGNKDYLANEFDLCLECMISLTNWLKRGEEYESE